MQRAICDVVASAGQGVGGFATVILYHAMAGADDRLRAWTERAVSAAAAMRQVAAAHAWVAASGEPASPTTALSARAATERPVGWVLMIEASDPDSLSAARDAVLAGDPAANGAEDVRAYPLYQLLYVLER
jgi:hypothetical protein